MIKVYIKKDCIVIKGHANYDEYGKDIVCASVSSIVTTSVNACLRLSADSVSYRQESGMVKIDILKSSRVVDSLMENMIAMLEELELTYQKNIKIIKEERL